MIVVVIITTTAHNNNNNDNNNNNHHQNNRDVYSAVFILPLIVFGFKLKILRIYFQGAIFYVLSLLLSNM